MDGNWIRGGGGGERRETRSHTMLQGKMEGKDHTREWTLPRQDGHGQI